MGTKRCLIKCNDNCNDNGICTNNSSGNVSVIVFQRNKRI